MANRSRGPRFLEAYRRVTSNGRFIPEIDGLRFIAISLVFVALRRNLNGTAI
jgi:hypothetical protein